MTECGHWPASSGPLPSWADESIAKLDCRECDDDENEQTLWICLSCLVNGRQMVLCSERKHAQAHYRVHSHNMVANLKTDEVWCFQCNGYTKNKEAAVSPFQPMEAFANPEGGQMGLINLENTCFFNSSVQALLHCPPLIGYFLTTPDLAQLTQPKELLAREFALLVQKAWVPSAKPSRAYAPRELFKTVLKINPYFRGFGQHDAQELLRCILDTLHEGLQLRCEYDYSKHPLPPDEEDAAEESEKQSTEQEAKTNVTSKKNGAESTKRAGKKSERKQPEKEVSTEKKITASSPTSETKSEGSTEKKEEKAKAKPYYEPASAIADIFQGQLLSEITCLQCGVVSIKEEPFYDLSLELPKDKTLKKVEQERGHATSTGGGWLGLGSVLQYVGLVSSPISLETCLHSFCVSEELLKGDQYKCEKCKIKVDAKKTLAISALPEVLCLHIKRFAHNSYYGSKVSRHVTFPMQALDMTPFCKSPPAKKKRKLRNSIVDGNNKYDLFAMVRHMGSSGGGHYVAYTKSHVTQQWLRFSDHEVCSVAEDQIPKQEAYILFYRRQADISSQRAVRDLVTAGQAGTDLTCLVSTAWLKKLDFMSRGYPVDNRTLFCRHGFEHSREELQKRGVWFSNAVYQRLVARVGGGPLTLGSHESDVSLRCPTCNLVQTCQEEKTKLDAIDSALARDKTVFCMLHMPWLTLWTNFVSSNGPRPGPISNHLLLEGDVPKAGLIRGQDYTPVKDTVWEALQGIYGGGPLIVRNSSNIYSVMTQESDQEQDGGHDDRSHGDDDNHNGDESGESETEK